jgi:glycosyltransferase involved in cell wall biosynthesis
MNILYLSQVTPYPIDAGPKVRSYHVLQYLAAAGHLVTLVAFRRPSDRPEHLDHLQHYCTAIHTVPMKRSRVKDLWYLGKSLAQNRPFLIERDHVDAMCELIISLVQGQQFDAIHADQLWMAQYALSAQTHLNGYSKGTQLILDQHNAVHLIAERLAESEPNVIKRWILEREASAMKRYEAETCARFDRVVWVTDEDRRIMENASARSIDSITIPICIDSEVKSEIQKGTRPRRVTFLGGLHWPPNAAGIVWFAREVWPQVLQQVPDACLTVIGKEPPQALLSHGGKISNLDVTGYVDDPESLLAETAVFIVPLHAGGGMRVKILDAWAWGLPIVSTTIGAEGINYRDGIDLLVADSKQDFAESVVNVLKRPELAERLSNAGRNKVETEYDWRRTYRAWDQIYPSARKEVHY